MRPGTGSRPALDLAEPPSHLVANDPAKRTVERQAPLPVVAPAVGETEVLSAPAALDVRLRVVGRRGVVLVHLVELEDRVRHAATAEVAAAPEPLPELDEPGVLHAVLLGVSEVALAHPRPPGNEALKETIIHVRSPADSGHAFDNSGQRVDVPRVPGIRPDLSDRATWTQ